MWSSNSVARFERDVETGGAGDEVSFADLVDLADRQRLPLAEAAAALLDERHWQRVFVDEQGRTVHPDIAARAFEKAVLGGHCPYRVTWRRAGPSSGYLLA